MLETERLVIRPFQTSDYHDLYEYLSLEEIYRFEPGRPISLKEAKEMAAERAGGTNFLAAALKGTDQKVIGHVSFFRTEPDVFRTWEIGYIFNPVYHNRGYCTEATRAVIHYAFKDIQAHRIIASCNPENIASWRVLEKCGMTREGLNRKNAFFRTDGTGISLWFDSYSYAILADDCR